MRGTFPFCCPESIPTRAPREAQKSLQQRLLRFRQLAIEGGVSYEEIPDIGIGAPGMICEGVILYSNNLQLHQVPFAQMLQKYAGKPVFLENDANTAALGEFFGGAGKACRSMEMITLGTGIGSGLILNGKIYTGENGFGGEMGHMLLHPGGRRCTCGAKGRLRPTVQRLRAGGGIPAGDAARPESVMWEICGGDPKQANGRTAFDAMRRGDLMGRRVVLRFLQDLAIELQIPSVFLPWNRSAWAAGLRRRGTGCCSLSGLGLQS